MDLNTLFRQNQNPQVSAMSTAPISQIYSKPSEPTLPIPKINKYRVADRGVDITDNDIEALRPLIYGEVSNRDKSKKMLEAGVIFNTALNRAREYSARGEPKTVAEILAMPNQYQAYGGQQYKNYSNPSDVLAQQKKQEVDDIVNSIHQQVKSGSYPDITNGAYYYVHDPQGRIIYDDKRKLFK